MDIYGAVNQIGKILEWANSIENTNQSFYNKSISRLEYIAETSQKVANIVNGTLGVDTEPQKVVTGQNSHLEVKMDFLTNEIGEIKELLKGVSNQPKVTEQVQEKPKPPVNNDKSFTPSDRKAIVSSYANVLEKLAKNNCKSRVANQCADILWKWYDARIFGV